MWERRSLASRMEKSEPRPSGLGHAPLIESSILADRSKGFAKSFGRIRIKMLALALPAMKASPACRRMTALIRMPAPQV